MKRQSAQIENKLIIGIILQGIKEAIIKILEQVIIIFFLKQMKMEKNRSY